MLVSSRRAKLERITKETAVTVQVNIDGTGKTNVKTGLSFIDHLVTSIGKHAMIDVTVNGKSNDGIVHHLAEDVAIALAQTIDKALGDRTRIARFGYALIPMDEALAYVSIDLVKRQYQRMELRLTRDTIEEVPREDLEHFVRSLVQNLNACTHVIVHYGDNDHHKVEAALKAFAVALRMAISMDRKRKGVPSTKGAM
ncbi:MAG: imidazoleglycerol-phosphate dehydratase [Thaumarchaeota archaeon 13_1_40CM_3_50_5]|nr:MAG: imidazoleglycerol-phosphate dehydratase [Thaumarchaeota archaeon 13_1_40CM_4_48_7]OLC84049.1 MAG: imidazoleglycerol-phosphate dehydratase [Thaumarchaeota archaeon 13_1_40CM_3_50_5]